MNFCICLRALFCGKRVPRNNRGGVYNDPRQPGCDRGTTFEIGEVAGRGQKRVLHSAFRVLVILQNTVRNSHQSIARNRKQFLKQLVLLCPWPSLFPFEAIGCRSVRHCALLQEKSEDALNLPAGCVAGSSGFKIRAVWRRPVNETTVNLRERVPPAVVIALLSLRDEAPTAVGVAECEEQLAHGDFKTVIRSFGRTPRGFANCPPIRHYGRQRRR